MKYHLTKEMVEDQIDMEEYIDQRLEEMMGVPRKYMGEEQNPPLTNNLTEIIQNSQNCVY